jgi:hypothetical protein
MGRNTTIIESFSRVVINQKFFTRTLTMSAIAASAVLAR